MCIIAIQKPCSCVSQTAASCILSLINVLALMCLNLSYCTPELSLFEIFVSHTFGVCLAHDSTAAHNDTPVTGLSCVYFLPTPACNTTLFCCTVMVNHICRQVSGLQARTLACVPSSKQLQVSRGRLHSCSSARASGSPLQAGRTSALLLLQWQTAGHCLLSQVNAKSCAMHMSAGVRS